MKEKNVPGKVVFQDGFLAVAVDNGQVDRGAGSSSFRLWQTKVVNVVCSVATMLLSLAVLQNFMQFSSAAWFWRTRRQPGFSHPSDKITKEAGLTPETRALFASRVDELFLTNSIHHILDYCTLAAEEKVRAASTDHPSPAKRTKRESPVANTDSASSSSLPSRSTWIPPPRRSMEEIKAALKDVIRKRETIRGFNMSMDELNKEEMEFMKKYEEEQQSQQDPDSMDLGCSQDSNSSSASSADKSKRAQRHEYQYLNEFLKAQGKVPIIVQEAILVDPNSLENVKKMLDEIKIKAQVGVEGKRKWVIVSCDGLICQRIWTLQNTYKSALKSDLQLSSHTILINMTLTN